MGEERSGSRPELIEARELTDWDADDAFSHQDIASQLAELAVTVPTPANIALYGPWGVSRCRRRLTDQYSSG